MLQRASLILLLTSLSATSQDPVAIDPSHYLVEVNNDAVRVLRVRYKAGEGSPMHEHTAGVRVFLTNATSRFEAPDGSTRQGVRRAGDILWSEKVKHANRNIGTTDIEILELDFKGLPDRRAKAPAATSPPDPFESVVLENEFVRVLRLLLPPGAKTSTHTHPASVVISMSGEGSDRKGIVSWADAVSHSPENLSTHPVETLIVELRRP